MPSAVNMVDVPLSSTVGVDEVSQGGQGEKRPGAEPPRTPQHFGVGWEDKCTPETEEEWPEQQRDTRRGQGHEAKRVKKARTMKRPWI